MISAAYSKTLLDDICRMNGVQSTTHYAEQDAPPLPAERMC